MFAIGCNFENTQYKGWTSKKLWQTLHIRNFTNVNYFQSCRWKYWLGCFSMWENDLFLGNVTVCTVLELEQCSYQKKDFILCGWSLSTIATASSKVVAATLASILIPPMRCWCCLMSWKDLLICVSWRSAWRFVVGARNSTNVTALSRWYSLLYTLTLVNRMNDVTATPFCQPLAK